MSRSRPLAAQPTLAPRSLHFVAAAFRGGRFSERDGLTPLLESAQKPNSNCLTLVIPSEASNLLFLGAHRPQTTLPPHPIIYLLFEACAGFYPPNNFGLPSRKSQCKGYIDRFAVIYHNEESHVCVRSK
jgi:hypothetical protein